MEEQKFSTCSSDLEWERKEAYGMKQWTDIVKNLTILTQFGLSFITPLLLCLGLCWWLYSRVGAGGWVFIPGFFFGMGGSAMVAYKLYLSVTKGQKKEKDEKKKKVSFNRHI